MMKTRRLFIIGSSLFAESLAQLLSREGGLAVIGTAPTAEAALPTIKTEYPDAVIVAGTIEASQSTLGLLLTAYPDMTVICTDLNSDYMQVITSQRVGAHPSDLMAALAQLPQRR